jgi:amino acid transporter
MDKTGKIFGVLFALIALGSLIALLVFPGAAMGKIDQAFGWVLFVGCVLFSIMGFTDDGHTPMNF